MKRLPWHPPLLAALFVVFNYIDTGVHPAAGGRALLVAVLGTLVVQAVLTALLRNRHRGASATLVALAIVIFWIPLTEIPSRAVALPAAQLLTIGGLALALTGYLAWLSGRGRLRLTPRATEVTYGANVMSLTLSVVVAITFAGTSQAAELPRDLGIGGAAVSATPDADTDAPDIYLFMLDGHPRADSIAEQTGYDNSGFIAELEGLGFDVASDSRSNHRWTVASITTLFHMRPLHEVSEVVARAQTETTTEARRVLREAPAFEILREHGYVVNAIGPPYESASLRDVDQFADVGYLNSFECHLVRRTAIGSALWTLDPSILTEPRRDGIERSLEVARQLSDSDGGPPDFAFVHLPTPHVPVLWTQAGDEVDDPFGHECAPQNATGIGRGEYTDAYLQSMAYAEELVLDAIRDIKARSDEPPVIVVFSDHGPHFKGSYPDHTDPIQWRDSFANLLAAHAPGSTDLMADDISLVNLLPELFDRYLGTDLPRHSDDSYDPSGRLAPEP